MTSLMFLIFQASMCISLSIPSFRAVLDAEEAETAAAHELNATQQEESAVWEIVGKLACLGQAFGTAEEDGEEDNEAEMLLQLKKLQQEAEKMVG